MPAPTIDILLVEDNPGDVRLAQETLKDYRIQNTIHVVVDGEEALKYLRKQAPYENVRQPDMVLLDLNLPKLDGLEVLTEMQSDPDLRHIAVVVLTATSLDRELMKRYRITTDCFIQKPLTLDRYLDAVRCFPQFGVSIVRVAAR
jgi:two-component system response regulator